MTAYKHILVATDFTEHCEDVVKKAKDMAEKYQAKLSVIHVVDNLPITDAAYGPIIPFEIDMTKDLMEAAKKHLAEQIEKLALTVEHQFLELGSPKLEIIRVADDNEVDLIVLGSHGRHGLALLLGSTANGVLHHATCDVLAVRLQDD